jgi:oligopeptide/dipeptide ABC transporter ATP-binding protein
MRPVSGVIAGRRPDLPRGGGRARLPRAWLRAPKVGAGAGVLGLFVLLAVVGPVVAPYDPSATGADTLAPPSLQHLFGTTATGEDVFSQVLTGTRLSLEVGLLAALVAELLAVIVGVTSGFLGGLPDEGLSAVSNVFLVIPVLPLQIVLVEYLGAQSWVVLALVIAVTAWPHGARRLRAQTLSIRRRDYIQAARAMGEPNWRIIGFEIVPNLLAIIATGFLFQVTFAIVVQASLAFLGLGDPSQWSWGTILYWAGNSNAFLVGAWWWYVPPGLCLAFLGMGLALVNLGIDEVINPRLRNAGQVRDRRPAPAAEPPFGPAPPGDAVIDVRGLRVEYATPQGPLQAVRGVDLTLRRGQVLGIAGESGSGKSTLAYAIARLLRAPGRVVGGQVLYRPRAGGSAWVDVLKLSPEELRRFRWERLSLVFQAAMNSLNPVLTIRSQLVDTLATHRPETAPAARLERAAELLELVGIDRGRLSAYPHQLSGGQRQRVMIAMALALDPEVVIMDEPTTALDVVVQREILSRLVRLRERLGITVVFITHDLSLLAEIADTIAVMYAGQVVEHGPARSLTRSPSHPYTAALLASFPSLHGRRRDLHGIRGVPPDLRMLPAGCPFHPRCPEAVAACAERVPLLAPAGGGRQVACLLREPSAVARLTREQRERLRAAGAGGNDA